jgi:surfactin synthase thioesterase subunit
MSGIPLLSETLRLWLMRFKPSQTARLCLFCFPYAGGGATAYRPWVNHFPASIEVSAIKLPGRENRIGEAPRECLSELIPVLASVIASHADIPFAFFGHSMGALICFELARELRRQHLPEPVHLFVSAFHAPQHPAYLSKTHQLPEAEFLAEVGQRWGGIPEAVRNEPDLLALLLPTLRADLTIVETYTYVPEAPLTCPVSCFGGTEDQTVTHSVLAPWQQQTTGAFSLTMFPGNHFYIQSMREALSQIMLTALARWIT